MFIIEDLKERKVFSRRLEKAIFKEIIVEESPHLIKTSSCILKKCQFSSLNKKNPSLVTKRKKSYKQRIREVESKGQ